MALTYYQSGFTDAGQPEGTEGTIYGNDKDCRVVNFKNGEASAAIDFGRFVKRDSGSPADEADLPAASSDVPVGLTLAPQDGRVSGDTSAARDYDAGAEMDVMQSGTAWVVASESVTAGGDVYALISPAADKGKAAASTGGTKAQVSLTVSGELDGGVQREQTITLDADLVSSNTFDGEVGGAAIETVTYATSHDATMEAIVFAIEAQLAQNGSNASVALTDAANNRQITIVSDAAVPSGTSDALTNFAIAGGASQAGIAIADQQAGAAPHALSVAVDGTTVGPVAWAGSHDDTMALFAEQLEGLADVESAVVTVVPAGDDVTITLTAASPGADSIDLSSATVSNGATSRTMSVNNEVVAGTTQDAVLVPGAVYLDSGSATDLVRVRMDISG